MQTIFASDSTLKNDRCYDANFIVSGGTVGCHNEINEGKVAIMTTLGLHCIPDDQLQRFLVY